jgi:hypothetical protein
MREPVEFFSFLTGSRIASKEIIERESDGLHNGQLGDETESLLDCFHGSGRGRRFEPAVAVGTGCNSDSDCDGELVVGISERLVLKSKSAARNQAKERIQSILVSSSGTRV